jgi:hypothetical protein
MGLAAKKIPVAREIRLRCAKKNYEKIAEIALPRRRANVRESLRLLARYPTSDG